MKLPTPKQIPSGKWLMQLMVDGKRYNRAFDTPEDAYYWAAGIKTKSAEDNRPARSLTLEEAVDRYIESNDAVLSPSTVLEYKKIKRLRMAPLLNVRLQDLTQERIQRWVNDMAKHLAPKTVINAHGLMNKILTEYRPGLTLHTTLPQKIKTEIEIPTEEELRTIITASKGTKYELPIMLAIWLGLRMSEILGLRWADIDGDELHITTAIVTAEDGPVEKTTKTYSGKRTLRIPPYLKEMLEAYPHRGDHIINMTARAIAAGFTRICAKSGVPHYRFHDLRHVNASIMLQAKIPDKYAKKRMGHATDNMLKNVYQHTIREYEHQSDDAVDIYMESLLT